MKKIIILVALLFPLRYARAQKTSSQLTAMRDAAGAGINYRMRTSVPANTFPVTSAGQAQFLHALMRGDYARTVIENGYVLEVGVRAPRLMPTKPTPDPDPEPELAGYERVFVFGNSITHNQYTNNAGQQRDNGMDASAPEKDYLHLLTEKLKTLNSSVQVRECGDFPGLTIASGPYWEQTYQTHSLDPFEVVAQWKPQLIIMRVAENVSTTTDFADRYLALIDKLKSQNTSAIVVLSTSVWNVRSQTQVDLSTIIRQKGAERGYPVAELNNLPGAIDGKDQHPVDITMQSIADLIWEKIPKTVSVAPSKGYGNVYAPNSSYKPKNNIPVTGSGERNGAYNRVYLEGNGMKLGFNLTLAGTLDYISVPGQLGGKNQVNSPIWGNGKVDGGRQDPVSTYAYPNGNEEGPFHSNSGLSTRNPGLGWNQVEAGSEGDNPKYGILHTINMSDDSIYIENSGSQWEIPETAEQRNQKWISFDPDSPKAFREHIRVIMQRTDAQSAHYPSRRQQELKAFMRVSDFYKVYYCNGQPYQQQWASEIPVNNGGPAPFWGNEPGIIIENPETGACQALYAPLAGRFGYWNAREGSNNSQDFQFQFQYWASFPMLSLDPQGVYDVDIAIKNGTLAECRTWLYNQPRWTGTFNYVFNQKSRLAWTLHHGKDQLEAGITDGWNVSAITDDGFHDGKDFKIISPEIWVDGRVVKKIYVRAKFLGGAPTMTLFYHRVKPTEFAQLSTFTKDFSVQNDGVERVYIIDMSKESDWAGHDMLGFEIQHKYPYPDPVGANWNIKQISSSPITL